MLLIWPALVGAAVSAYGAYRTGKSAQRFGRDLSSTAHQREVSDLRAAGLNPILSATGGMGASSPTPNIPTIGREASAVAIASRQLKMQKVGVDAKASSDIQHANLMVQQQGVASAQRLKIQEETSLLRLREPQRGLEADVYTGLQKLRNAMRGEGRPLHKWFKGMQGPKKQLKGHLDHILGSYSRFKKWWSDLERRGQAQQFLRQIQSSEEEIQEVPSSAVRFDQWYGKKKFGQPLIKEKP